MAYKVKGTCVDAAFLVLGPYQTNVYIVSDGSATFVVDPASDAKKIAAALGGRKLDAIVLTHRHSDHVAAAAELGWTDREQATLSAARQALWDIEQTPASYYYNRNILNAFRRVVYNYETPRDVIGRYAREIDRELVRKRKQLG